MANTLLTSGQVATTSLVVMYTVPAVTTTMVFKVHCANKSSTATPTIKVSWNDGTTEFTLIENYAIPIGGAFDVLDSIGKKLLNAADTLSIQSDIASAVDVSIDYVEIT